MGSLSTSADQQGDVLPLQSSGVAVPGSGLRVQGLSHVGCVNHNNHHVHHDTTKTRQYFPNAVRYTKILRQYTKNNAALLLTQQAAVSDSPGHQGSNPRQGHPTLQKLACLRTSFSLFSLL